MTNKTNMRVSRFFTALFFLLLAAVSLGLQAREVKLFVAVTSDVHARLFPYDFLNDRPVQNSLANVLYVMESARARHGSSIIMLDNGDMLQGTPAAYFANFVQDEKKNLFSRVMNLVKYDAATIGNHDIEAGPAVYNRLKSEFNFPWLGANVIDAESGKPYFEPYTIIRRQGINIAIIGLTTPSVPNWLPPHLWEGLQFQDMVESARYWVDHIRENESADAIIGLFHSGMGTVNVDESDHPLENASAYIARNVPGFDVIFTGHDHRQRIEVVRDRNGDEVLVVGPGHFAENIAVVELVFNRVERRVFRLADKRAEMVRAMSIAPSQSFFQAFEKDMTEILIFANRNVVRNVNEIRTRDALFGGSAVADLVHDFQLHLTGADISFTAPLAFNETIRAGQLQVRDFFRIYEYENYLYTMELTGKEIYDYLEYSYGLWFNEMKNENDHLLLFRFNDDGEVVYGTQPRFMLRHPFYSFDSAAGIKYAVDVSKPSGSRVLIISMEDGSAFEMEKKYRVAINSYRGSGGGGHLTEGAGISHHELTGRIIKTSERNIRSSMIDYFGDLEVINPEVRGNWTVVPEEWGKKGMERDLQVLFK